MHCFRCGRPVAEGQRFCGSCGNEVSDPSAATVATATAPPPLLSDLRRHLAGEYEITRELGRGGMGIVYQAVEVELHRPVALKVLPPEMAHVASIAERFKREARLAASLDHPNIIPIYRVGQAGGTLYIAMKFIEGRAVDAVVEREGPLPLHAAILVLRSAASALAYAHSRGVIHRDIKGGNILLDAGGRAIVTDFGIARAAEDAGLTASGAVVGTPHFMSPEQCSGKPLGPQCDQYSLGVVGFQVLSGRLPFDAESLPGIMHHHFFTPVPDLAVVRGDVPRALRDVIARAMAKKPEERYATTDDMVAALDAVPMSESERDAGESALRALSRGAGGTVQRGGRSPRPSAAPTVAPRRATRVLAAAVWGAHRKAIAGAALVLLAVLATVAVIGARTGPRAELARGVEYFHAGQVEAARLVFTKVADEQPRLAEPHIFLGRLARVEGDFRTAQRELQTALRLDPRNATAMREMGGLMLTSGRLELARRFYGRALELAPGDRSTHGYLGCTLLKLGETAQGRRHLEQAGAGPWTACRVSGQP